MIENKNINSLNENKESIPTSEKLANLNKEIFDKGNIDRLPFREEDELKYYILNNNDDFVKLLTKHLSTS